jgi:hypothetical protein
LAGVGMDWDRSILERKGMKRREVDKILKAVRQRSNYISNEVDLDCAMASRGIYGTFM